MPLAAHMGSLICTILVLYLLVVLGEAQVLTSFRDQPRELRYGNAVGSCCERRDGLGLYDCIRDSATKEKLAEASHGEVLLVSYSTPSILGYAGYAHAATAAYAAQNGYSYEVLTPASGHDYEPRDARWNKVRILEELARDTQHEYGEYEYVVWMDSDLIVLDMGLSIAAVVAQNPEAHVIMSADPLPEEINSVANTGMIITRRSHWSVTFFHEWWTRQDRGSAWDQHVFTALWESDFEHARSQGKVVLLAPDAVNSWRPAAEKQQPYNQVLHMIGSVPQHRRAVFQRAWEEVCGAYTQTRVLAPQLGVSREVLVEIEEAVLGSGPATAQAFLSKMLDVDGKAVSREALGVLLEEWGVVRRLNEPDNEHSASAGPGVRRAMEDGLSRLAGVLFAAAIVRQGDVTSIQTALDMSIELAVLFLDGAKVDKCMDTLDTVTMLPDMLPASLDGAGTYYKFKLEQLMASASGDVVHWRAAMRWMDELLLVGHPSALNTEGLDALGAATLAECSPSSDDSRIGSGGDAARGVALARRGLQLAGALRLQQLVPREAVDQIRRLLEQCQLPVGKAVPHVLPKKATKKKKTAAKGTGKKTVYRRRKSSEADAL